MMVEIWKEAEKVKRQGTQAALCKMVKAKGFLCDGCSAKLLFMLTGSYSPMSLLPILLFLFHTRGYWNQ